jgi:hypothetical protein
MAACGSQGAKRQTASSGALTIDSAACVDSVRYCRYRPQELGRALKTLPVILSIARRKLRDAQRLHRFNALARGCSSTELRPACAIATPA